MTTPHHDHRHDVGQGRRRGGIRLLAGVLLAGVGSFALWPVVQAQPGEAPAPAVDQPATPDAKPDETPSDKPDAPATPATPAAPDAPDAPAGETAPVDEDLAAFRALLPAELPEFKDFNSIMAFFEPVAGRLRTEFEQRERRARVNPDRLRQLGETMRQLDTMLLEALVAYRAAHEGAEDLPPAVRESVLLASRLGRWADAERHADAYLAAFADRNADARREVRFLRADALSQQDGREIDAIRSLREVIAGDPDSLEANLARARLLRLLVLTGDIAAARALIESVAALPDVEDDPEAQAWLDGQRHAINQIGLRLPRLVLTGHDGKEVTADTLKPHGRLLLWYWDSTEGPSVAGLAEMKALAAEMQGKIKVVAVATNRSREAWKEFVDRERRAGAGDGAADLLHVFEGRVGRELSSVALGVSVLPTAILVGTDHRVYRYDVAGPDLRRTIQRFAAEE